MKHIIYVVLTLFAFNQSFAAGRECTGHGINPSMTVKVIKGPLLHVVAINVFIESVGVSQVYIDSLGGDISDSTSVTGTFVKWPASLFQGDYEFPKEVTVTNPVNSYPGNVNFKTREAPKASFVHRA
jgi:hypothetical protein